MFLVIGMDLLHCFFPTILMGQRLFDAHAVEVCILLRTGFKPIELIVPLVVTNLCRLLGCVKQAFTTPQLSQFDLELFPGQTRKL